MATVLVFVIDRCLGGDWVNRPYLGRDELLTT
jgi:hypothetical protein